MGLLAPGNTYLCSLYYRLAPRIGKSRVRVAVGRTILQAAYFMLLRQEPNWDMGEAFLDQRDREFIGSKITCPRFWLVLRRWGIKMRLHCW